jgi:cytoskeletal protein RodZ
VTTPQTDGPGEPSVSTAPPAAPRRWWSSVPHHLGRARTSTVVLALLFVGLYVLWLYVRPPDLPTAPATGGTTVQTPATTSSAEPPATTEPTTTAPSTTAPSPTSAVPTSSPGEETPSETTTPAPTPAGEEPTTTQPPTPAAPTTGAAPGS